MFHVKQFEAHSLIGAYISALKAYNSHTNIYAKSAYDKLPFHIQDCLHMAALIGNKKQVVVDMGSGSGLPSIILAIANPKNQVIALESKGRKTTFLAQVCNDLALENYQVIQSDILALGRKRSLKADVVTAKAFAPWDKCVAYASWFAKQGSYLLVPVSAQQADSLPAVNTPDLLSVGSDYHYFKTEIRPGKRKR